MTDRVDAWLAYLRSEKDAAATEQYDEREAGAWARLQFELRRIDQLEALEDDAERKVADVLKGLDAIERRRHA